MSQTEEWDWPPPRRGQAQQIEVESRIVDERIVLPRRQAPPRRSHGFGNPPAGPATTILVTALKVAVAIPLGGILFACVWLIGAILRA